MDAPYFPFYPADWLSDPNAQILTLEESGAYINLLAYMWRDGKDCTLPDDDKYIARLLHVPPRKWMQIRKSLIDGPGAVIHRTEDGVLWNNRLREEWCRAADKIEKNKAAANKRWGNVKEVKTDSKRNADASQTHMRNDAISESDTDPESDPDLKKDDDDHADDLKLVEGESSNRTSPTVNPYDELEHIMRVRMVKPNYILKTTEYQAVQELLQKEIPLDFILDAVGFAFDYKQKHDGEKIQSFSYCVPVIERLWSAELAKNQFKAEFQVSATNARDGPIQKQRDERYSAFYQLFPDE